MQYRVVLAHVNSQHFMFNQQNHDATGDQWGDGSDGSVYLYETPGTDGESICLANTMVSDIMNNRACHCLMFSSTKVNFSREITLQDILSGRVTWIIFESGFNPTSTPLLLGLLGRGLVRKLRCSNMEQSFMPELTSVLKHIRLDELILPPCGHATLSFLGAIVRNDITVNRLIMTNFRGPYMPEFFALCSSPTLTVTHIEFHFKLPAYITPSLLSKLSGGTWLRTIVMEFQEETAENTRIYKKIQNLLLVKHQLLALLHDRQNHGAVSKLPNELLRMMSTFLT